METKNPEPFESAHRAVLTSSVPIDGNVSRHEVEAGLHVILASSIGSPYPEQVAFEFDAATWSPDRALEWLLTRGTYVARFQRAG